MIFKFVLIYKLCILCSNLSNEPENNQESKPLNKSIFNRDKLYILYYFYENSIETALSILIINISNHKSILKGGKESYYEKSHSNKIKFDIQYIENLLRKDKDNCLTKNYAVADCFYNQIIHFRNFLSKLQEAYLLMIFNQEDLMFFFNKTILNDAKKIKSKKSSSKSDYFISLIDKIDKTIHSFEISEDKLFYKNMISSLILMDNYINYENYKEINV
ncbi:hypothetical protein GVAV_002928 [Gurleya vavrai]